MDPDTLRGAKLRSLLAREAAAKEVWAHLTGALGWPCIQLQICVLIEVTMKLVRQTPKRRRVVTVRKPGQPGTIKLLKKYGRTLRNVRYVYDYDTGEHYKTMELFLVIENDDKEDNLPPDIWVGIEIGRHERELRAKVQAVGGRYDTYDRLWFIRYADYRSLNLDDRAYTIKETVGEYKLD